MQPRLNIAVRTSTMAMVLVVALALVPVALRESPAGAVPVGSEAQLRANFDTAASVELTTDITLTSCAGGGALTRTTASPVVVDGNGFTLRQTCPDDLFRITNGAALTLQRVVGVVGAAGNDGVESNASVTLVDSSLDLLETAISDGIFVNTQTAATVRLVRSLVNGAADDGIATGGAGVVTVELSESTIARSDSVGIFTQGASPVSLVNSTVTSSLGDGIATIGTGTVTLVYATVIGNQAGNVQHGGTLTSFGSVVAQALVGVSCSGAGATSSRGFNYSDDATCGFTTATDHEDAPDPDLEELAANGGPTPTFLPGAASPLVDVIPLESCQADGAAGVTIDQRLLPRPSGDGCDIGAVEVQVPVPPTPIVIDPRFTG